MAAFLPSRLLWFGLTAWVGLCSAQAKSPYERGVRYFQGFEFGKAAEALKQALKGKLAPPKRAQAHLLRSLSLYNLARRGPARAAYFRALDAWSKVFLPKGQSPGVYRHYAQLRQEWQRRRSKAAAKAKARPPATARPPARARAPEKPRPRARPRLDLRPGTRHPGTRHPVTRRPVTRRPVTRRLASRAPAKKLPAPRLSPWSRHRASLILGGIGLALLASGGAVALVLQGQNQRLQQLDSQPQHPGKALMDAYSEAFASAAVMTSLLAGGGVVLAVAAVVFATESRPRRP